jgi:hypothetical protein
VCLVSLEGIRGEGHLAGTEHSMGMAMETSTRKPGGNVSLEVAQVEARNLRVGITRVTWLKQ